MNFIDKLIERIESLSADDLIQSLADIYKEQLERAVLKKYPQFIQDIVWIIDLDTELCINGIGGLLENLAGQYTETIAALRHISADGEAELLERIQTLYKDDPANTEIDELAGKLYLYTEFDIWPLLENYVASEKAKYYPSTHKEEGK